MRECKEKGKMESREGVYGVWKRKTKKKKREKKRRGKSYKPRGILSSVGRSPEVVECRRRREEKRRQRAEKERTETEQERELGILRRDLGKTTKNWGFSEIKVNSVRSNPFTWYKT